MKLLFTLLLPVLCAPAASLRGTVTDPSGAAVPQAAVQLRGPGGERHTVTADTGEFTFPSLNPGKYQVLVKARGFAPAQRKNLQLEGPLVLDIRLAIESGKETITVSDDAGRIGTAPSSNGGAVTLGARQVAALSDDPDELALQLQALAGPAPGPNGGQVFIDGFGAGNLPPKSAIAQVQVNANPFSPEFDRPGFGRIDIHTKPGSEAPHGQAFVQYNDRLLNARNPLLAQSTRPAYVAKLFGIDFGAPLLRNRSSFTIAAERREIGENALILATLPDAIVNQALPAPQTRTSVSPRIDWTLNARNTLSTRYLELRVDLKNQGAGDFALPSRAYRERQGERLAQLTETAVLSPRAISETRLQYRRPWSQDSGGANSPAIDVLGAFSGGGSPVGNSASVSGNWEAGNLTTWTRGAHTWRLGARVRQERLSDTSLRDFAGAFTFYSLEQYRNGTPAQFSLNVGNPTTNIVWRDAAVFAGDDWRLRRNLTASLGLRYEAQNRIGGLAFAPRAGIASSFGKTVLRAGAGVFYDRVPIDSMLNAARYNGVTQQSYVILNPAFFPGIPTAGILSAETQPQELRPLYAGIRAARLYQGSVSVERQLDAASKISVAWIETRGLHLPNARNINTPIAGAWPFGDRSIRLLTEDAGRSRQRQMVVNANVNRKHVTMFGYYALSYGRDNNEGLPADPYNLRAEWGASTYGDVRHRAVWGATLPLPVHFSLSPFVVLNSGVPYNITTGLDPLGTGFPEARPALLPRNSGRGPAAQNLGLRLSKTWTIRDYNIALSASSINALNHTNLGPPDGDMASPYFGQSRSLGGLIVMMHGGGASTYNRKIDLQLRVSF